MGFIQNLKQYFLNSNKKRTEVKGTDRIILLPLGINPSTPIDYNTVDDLLDYVKKNIPSGGGGSASIVSKTYAEMATLISTATLVAGQMYYISDKGIYVLALTTSELDLGNSAMHIRVPNIYANGFWSSGGTYTAGDRVIWGGKIWANVSGNLGAPVDDFSLDAEWSLVAESDADYTDFYLGCTYDFTNDWVSKAWDNRGNVAGCSYEYAQDYGFPFNPVNHCDWGDMITIISNNNVLYFCNNVSSFIAVNNLGYYFISGNTTGNVIANNSNVGNISNNSNTGDITGNSNKAGISNNSNGGSIQYNSNAGYISSNDNTGSINNNSNAGSISDNSNTGDILSNFNAGEIYGNTSQVLDISGNFNAGYINSNSNTGQITNNSNNGYIHNLSSVVLNVYNNTNNGDISTSTAGDIFDTIVNK